jgi:hypothetical protein
MASANELAQEAAKAATNKIGDVTSQALKWLADVKLPPLPGTEPKTTAQIGHATRIELAPAAGSGAVVPPKNPAPIKMGIPVPPRLSPLPPPPKGRKH